MERDHYILFLSGNKRGTVDTDAYQRDMIFQFLSLNMKRLMLYEEKGCSFRAAFLIE